MSTDTILLATLVATVLFNVISARFTQRSVRAGDVGAVDTLLKENGQLRLEVESVRRENDRLRQENTDLWRKNGRDQSQPRPGN